MSRSWLWALIAMIALVASSSFADKVTTDPNAGTKPVQVVLKADPRLQKLVTYQEGYGRLSEIADRLTRLSGVTIRAGQNSMDWRVRDIPLVVCVKDIPLGKLLKSIAAAAHIDLTAHRVKDAPIETSAYRFFRKQRDQDAIDRSLEAVAQANLDLAKWAWDTLVAYAKMPEANLTIPPEKYDFNKIDSSQVRIVSELLASFGTEARHKALAGEQVTVTYAKAPRQDLMRKLFEYVCTHPGFGILQRGVNSKQQIEWNEKDVGKSLMAIRIIRRDSPAYNAGLSFLLYGIPVEMEGRRSEDTWSGDLLRMAKALAATKELKLPPPPDAESVFRPKDRFPLAEFTEVDLEQDSRTPPLDRKVTLKPDPMCPRPTTAQAVVYLSKASNLSIVAEDFSSHSTYGAARVDWNVEKAVGETLAEINRGRGHCLKWFLDSNTGTLVGWSDEWRKRHRNLVAGKLLDGIKAKRETTGAEIDDLVPLLGLSEGQRSEWVNNTSDYLGRVDTLVLQHLPIWHLYNALTREDKAIAKTESGLPLAEFDTQWVRQFLSSKLSESRQGTLMLYDADEFERHTPSVTALADPEVLKSCTLRIRQVEQRQWEVPVPDTEGSASFEQYSWFPGGIEKHTYEVSLTGKLDGKEKTLESTWDGVFFPFYTFQKEAELIKKAGTKDKE